jgi:hypothetical protein
VEPLGATALLAPAADGAWPRAGERPAAHAASAAAALTVASSVALSSAAFFTAVSSVVFSFVALFVVASSTARFAAFSLSVVAASSSTVGPAPESCHSCFCRGSSSSDNTSSSSRMAHVCLPLLGAAVLEPPAAMEPPTAPPRPPAGCHYSYLPDHRLPGGLHGHDHQQRRPDCQARG